MDKPVDTVQTPAPQPDATPSMAFELVDTPEGTPEGGGTAVNAQPQPVPQEKLYFGKYRTPEDAETAFKEAERKMHEATQKASAYEKMLMERAAAPTPPQPSGPPDEKFREMLAEDPMGTLESHTEFKIQQVLKRQQEQQRQVMSRFQQFAGNPEFADVANEVAQQLPFATEPIDPVEGTFLRAQNAKLRQMLAARGGTPPPPLHVEGGNGNRPAGNTLRVELDDASKARRIFGDRTPDLAHRAAQIKTALGGRNSMSIDDYEGLNNA